MADFEVDASELDNANDNLSALIETVGAEAAIAQQDIADLMIEFIEKSIRLNFDDVRTKGDQTSLLDAFMAFPNGNSVIISTAWSDADHALPLELGKTEHKITSKSGKLAFQPENPTDYIGPSADKYDTVTDNARYSKMANQGNFVVVDSVQWKPTGQSAIGYEYVLEAQKEWEQPAKMKISDSLQDAIREAGFSRL